MSVNLQYGFDNTCSCENERLECRHESTTQSDRKRYQASHKRAAKTTGGRGGGGGEVGYWSRRDVMHTQEKKHTRADSRQCTDDLSEHAY